MIRTKTDNGVVTVEVDPDGTDDPFLYILMPATTGVVYSTEISGRIHDIASLEGYLVPVSDHQRATDIHHWFQSEFHGQSYQAEWTENRIKTLTDLVSAVPGWNTDSAKKPTKDYLRLDMSRIDELREGWIPVLGPRGHGYLITKNSGRG